jgi:hypothetical protein
MEWTATSGDTDQGASKRDEGPQLGEEALRGVQGLFNYLNTGNLCVMLIRQSSSLYEGEAQCSSSAQRTQNINNGRDSLRLGIPEVN